MTIYLAKDEEEKIKAIKNALLNEIPEVSVDFSKSRIVRMAIDKLYSILYHDKAGKK